jgi:hypothetical protein
MIANNERRESMETKPTERKSMDLVNFIVWLTAGAVIGWFANRMVKAQHKRRADKPTHSAVERSTEKS